MSSVQPVFVTNTGDAPLTILARTVAGANAADFAAAGTYLAPITLAPGARCRIELTLYAGSGQVTLSATLNVISDALLPAPPVLLTATLDNGALYLRPLDPSPDWIDFPPQQVGSAAAPATFSIDNVTGLDFKILRIELVGGNAADFALTSPCQPGGTFDWGTQCKFTIAFTPSAAGPRSTELRLALIVFGISGDSFYSVTGIGGGAPAPANYQGIWWNAPANSESGWGINFAHQNDTIFASWFTYDTTGRGWWLVMTAQKTGPNTYSGKLYTTRGPAFNSAVFDPKAVVATEAGTGTLTFTDANNGTFAYTVGAVSQMKAITRQVFGTLPTCAYGTQPNLALATNYQDLWWAKPGGVESGWGINLNHEGDTIFATWFTYDLDGTPLWLVATAPKASPGVYTGDLYRTSGARFDAFDGTKVVPVKVGTATFTFADGNNASFTYTVQVAGLASPVTQTKTITRELFSTSGTTCQ